MGRTKSTVTLSHEEIRLLQEILAKQYPEKVSAVDISLLTKLCSDDITPICQAITEEFCNTGLMPNSEPNKRGLMLEALLDKLRRIARAHVQPASATRKF